MKIEFLYGTKFCAVLYKELVAASHITHATHTSQNGQAHFKNFAAFGAKFLKCVLPFWEVTYIKGLS